MRSFWLALSKIAVAIAAAAIPIAVLPSGAGVHSVPGAPATNRPRAVSGHQPSRSPHLGGPGAASAATAAIIPSQPGDQFFPDQWGLTNIAAPEAWQQEQATGLGVTVAVIDTGIDMTHEDLLCPAKIRAVGGSDFIDGDGDPADENGHGTHVAGIIGACTDNGVGIAGVAPEASILPIRVLDASGSTTNVESMAQAIDLATAEGAQVINLSLTAALEGVVPIPAPGLVSFLDEAINHAVQSGVVVVAAAGNDGYSLCGYPSLVTKVVCVGAVDRRDVKAAYSNLAYKMGTDEESPAVVAPGGSLVLICDLPGENILSLWPERLDGCNEGRPGYTAISGTSMATPHVAGVAALVYGRLGGIRTETNGATVRRAIMENADDLGVPGLDPFFGFGRVNALRAVEAVDVVALAPTEPTASAPTRVVAGKESYSLTEQPKQATQKRGAPARPSSSLTGTQKSPVPLVDPQAPHRLADAGGGLGFLSLILGFGGAGALFLAKFL